MAELSGDYVLDEQRTRIGFIAAHRGGSKVRGQFNAFEGAVRLDAADPHGWLTVQTNSIDTGNRRRDAQLRKDFLDAATYPVMTFVLTNVSQLDDRRYDVTGNLAIRGTTRPLTIPFNLTDPAPNPHFTAAHPINRHHWHANRNAFTTALVRPNVTLALDIHPTRRQPTTPHPTTADE
ncbi:MAG TPA: YceI family protein [Kribbella sp.]